MIYAFDGTAKLIILNGTDLSVQDMYSRWVDWLVVSDNAKYLPAMRSVGGDAISAVKNLGLTYFMINGWRIRPQESNHRLTVSGNLFTDPSGFSPFTDTLGNYNVMIEMSVSSLVDSTVAQLPEIQHGVYENRVCINAAAGSIGTAYPIGTLQYPVNNLVDAKTIAAAKGFNTFFVIGSLTVDSVASLNGLTFTGTGIENSKMVLTQGCTTSKTTFRNMSLSGFQDGETHYEGCEIGELGGVHCRFVDCLLTGPVTLEEGTYADTTVLVNCYTGWDRKIVAPALKDECVINMNNSSVNMAFNNFYGKLKFTNLNRSTTPGTVAVNMGAGKITVDSTCTTGTIKVRGNGEVVDNSVGTVVDNDVTAALISVSASGLTVEQQTQLAQASEAALARKMSTNKAVISPDGLSVTIYDDDDTTVLHTFAISSDKNTRTPL